MVRSSLRVLPALLLFACGGIPHPPYSPQTTDALRPVEFAPPPGRVETIPPKPAQADAWVGGEWILRHGRWYWLLGRWVKTPPGARYSPWVSVHAVDGTAYFAPSVWRDAQGAPLPAPAPIVIGTASGEAVFDSEGDMEDTGRNIKTAPPSHPSPPDEQPSP
jgi:hypothetical protein